jgi:hypothetical protein
MRPMQEPSPYGFAARLLYGLAGPKVGFGCSWELDASAGIENASQVTSIGYWLFEPAKDPRVPSRPKGVSPPTRCREIEFIVAQYGPLDRERLRTKPGITGLWQISYARQAAIHENLDYDLYYIEHQSFLLDLVIIALTAFAVVKGTGAY